MPKTAKTEPNTTVAIANNVYQFGDDGTRQVSETEAEELLRAAADGGFKIEVTDSKRKG